MKENLISAWMKLFWESYQFTLPDIDNISGVNYGITYDIPSLVEINDKRPYGLFFTPNWNFGKANTPWEKVNRSNTIAEKYVSALYVDIDIKDTTYTCIEHLMPDVLTIIQEQQLPISYIVQSGWGLHLYMFVELESRFQVGWLWKYKELQESLAEIFPGWDKASHSLAKLMRLPFSNHWKTGKPIPVKLFKVEKDIDSIELEEVTSPEQITLPEYSVFHFEHIRNLTQNLVETIDVRRDMKTSIPSNITRDIDIVNKLPIESVFFKLEKYPRDTIGKLTVFKVKNNHIFFQITDKETGEVKIEHTDGYRINTQHNYVNNFSINKYLISDRPKGQVYAFLYYYFDKDIQKIQAFLEKEFNIKLQEEVKDTVMPPLKSWSGTIFFTQWGVIYKKEATTAQWKIVQKEVQLFRTPFKIKWVMESKYTMHWETSIPVKYYLIERLDLHKNNEFIINFSEDRKKFNRTYWQTWLIFLWEESDLLDFYLSVNYAVDAGQIPTYNLVYLNGLYKDYFLMGDKFIDKDYNLHNEWENTVLKTQPIVSNVIGRDEVTMTDFTEHIIKLYNTRIWYMSVLSYLTIFLWHNFWAPLKEYKQQFMVPWLLISGKTKVGKSTLIAMLKEGSWLTFDTKKLSALSSSPQPIKQTGTDSFLLHLEEFTWRIQPEKESIIRDIINKTNSSRWTPSGANIDYTYRAGIIIDWERLPASHSVVNRCIVVAMFENDKSGNEGTLYEMRNISFLRDLLNKVFKIKDGEVLTAYKQAEGILAAEGYGWRQLLLHSFLLAINILFKIAKNSEVIAAIKENIETLWEVSTDGDELSSLLSDIIINRRIIPRVIFDSMNNNHHTIVIPITSEILWEKQIEFIGLLRKYKGNISITNNKITISYTNQDRELADKISAFSQYFRQ